VAAPQAIAVPPARPTLNGGPGVGMPGQMGQPAIPSMPGYVLETSEDGRVLSKKKLQELVREVCGPGGDEQLTPEVEEVSTLSRLPRNPNHACHSPSNQTLLHTNHLCHPLQRTLCSVSHAISNLVHRYSCKLRTILSTTSSLPPAG